MNKNFNLSKALKAGYTDDEIEDHFAKKTGKKFNIAKAKKAGYSQDEIGEFLSSSVKHPEAEYHENPETGEHERHYGLGSTAIKHPKETALSPLINLVASPIEFFGRGHSAVTHGMEHLPQDLEKDEAERFQDLQQQAGMPITEHLSQLAGLNDLDEASKKDLDLLDNVLAVLPIEKVAQAVPALGKWIGKMAKGAEAGALGKWHPPDLSGPAFRVASEPEKLSSGLTKLNVLEAKNPHLAMLNSERQKRVVGSLEREASSLASKSLEKHVPMAKEIESGLDFGKLHKEEFGKIRTMMDRANPSIDTTPLNQFLSEFEREFAGIPKEMLPQDVRLALRHARAFRKHATDEGSKLLRMYRANNKIRSHLTQNAMTKGRQTAYMDYLDKFNGALKESIAKTLPEDSAWMKSFNEWNQHYKEHANARSTLSMLKQGTGEEINTSALRRLAKDPKKQERLIRSMGEEGAQEVIQIGKDLDMTVQALKRLPKSKVKALDGIFPIETLLPGIGKFLGIPHVLGKVVKGGREAYGFWLSTPKNRSVYDSLLHAFASGNETLAKELVQELKP